MEYSGFWAGAQRLGQGIDLIALAANAGGWAELEAAPVEQWVAWGVPEAKARRWRAMRPETTRGAAVTLDHPAYPETLRSLRCPPPVLCVEGSVERLGRRSVAIVGTRSCTSYGEAIARRLAADLASAGIVVVSGLARGIDTCAHAAAARGGYTVAVLAHGLSHTAPPSNVRLRERIVAEGGAVVSTWPDAYEPFPYRFPQRNAWISGLATDVVVVEAPLGSGAIGTARAAAEQGREVWAVPGPVGAAASRGCLDLIDQGARVLTDIDAFLAEIGAPVRPPPTAWLGPLFAGATLDEVARTSGRSAAELLAELAQFELRGEVVRISGQRYAPGRGR